MQKDKFAIPIAIGVSGHRDIDAGNPELNHILDQVMDNIRDKYPNSPFMFLSPLAEGADRIVAKKAMEKLDATLIAALPFHEEEYSKDFETTESKNEFFELLGKAKRKYVMPGGNKGEFHTLAGDVRNAQYSRAGAFVSRYSQFMIIIWDGQPVAGKGGTANIVDWEMTGQIPLEDLYPVTSDSNGEAVVQYGNPLELHDAGSVYHIKYENRKAPDKSKHKVTDMGELGEGEIGNFQNKDCSGLDVAKNLDELNKRMREHPILKPDYPLLYSEMHSLLSQDELETVTRIDGLYNYCDKYSDDRSKASAKLLKVIFWCFAFAVVSFAFIGLHFVFAIPFVLAFLAMYAPSKLAHKWKVKETYTEHRLLAEGLRVLFYWRISGVSESVSSRYLPSMRNEIGWVLEALANVELASGTAFFTKKPDYTTSQPLANRLKVVREKWMIDQKKYYEKAINKKDRKKPGLKLLSKKLYRLEKCLYWSAITLVIVCLCSWLLHLPIFSPDLVLGENQIVGFLVRPLQGIPYLSILPDTPQAGFFGVMLGCLASSAALLVFRREREALDEKCVHYNYAANMFGLASEAIKDANIASMPLPILQEVVLQAGIAALSEQGNWLSIQKSLPLEPPKATG